MTDFSYLYHFFELLKIIAIIYNFFQFLLAFFL